MQLTVQELEHIKAMVRQEAVMFCGEYSYRKANPETKMDVPLIVYEEVEKAYDEWKNK